MVTMTNLNLVIFFNQWNEFESDEIRNLFKALSAEELVALKKDDHVWVDTDPIHPNGKVYGFCKETITKIEKDSDKSLKIYHRSGFLTVDLKENFKICGVIDETRLLELTNQDFRSTKF